MKEHLVIIAAGKGTRMGIDIPKPLVKIMGKENILWLLESAKGFYDNYFVVIKKGDLGKFEYLNDLYDGKIKFIEIFSGKGDAHAILHFINKTFNKEIRSEDKLTVAWGDLYCPNNKIFNLISSYSNTRIYVPLLLETQPYTVFELTKGDYLFKATFNDKKVNVGLHDQSIFFGPVKLFRYKLQLFHSSRYNKASKKYNTTSGEMKLIETLNYEAPCSDVKGIVLGEDYGLRSFNTMADLINI